MSQGQGFERAYYILGGKDDHEPIPTDMLSWGQWFSDFGARCVAQDVIGGMRISTVFLGLDHNFAAMMGRGDDQRPHVFETMIFASERKEIDQYCVRCATWEEAMAQHRLACAIVEAVLAKG